MPDIEDIFMRSRWRERSWLDSVEGRRGGVVVWVSCEALRGICWAIVNEAQLRAAVNRLLSIILVVWRGIEW